MAADIGSAHTRDDDLPHLSHINVDATSEAVFWIAPDAHFVDVNLAACRSLGYTREELLKLGVPDIDAEFSAGKWREHMTELRRQGSFRFESTQRAKDGRLFPVEVVCNYVQIGGDERASAFVRDITERKRAEALTRLEHSVTRSLAEAGSSREVVKAVLRIICESEQWESSGYFRVEDDAGATRLMIGWSGPGARQKTIDYYKGAIGTVIPPGGLISRVIAEGKPIWIADLNESETTWHLRIARTGQRATFAFPVVADKKILGVLAFSSPTIRKPDEGLLQATRAIGEQVGQFIKRKQAEESLRESEIQLQSILGSTADGILAVDNDGKVIRTNRRFTDLWRIPQALLDGKDDRQLLDYVVSQLAEPEAFLGKVKMLYQSDLELLDVVNFKDGRIFERFSSPLMLEHSIIGRVWSFRDITERKRKESLMRLLETLACAANEAETAEAGLRDCLEQICAYGNWAIGHVGLYGFNQPADTFPISQWCGNDLSRDQEFIRQSETFIFGTSKGGFVGRAKRERKPVWIEDIRQAGDIRRQKIALEAGLRSAFVFPVFVGSDIAGFLEFFAADVRTPDTLFLDSINVVSGQLARLIERARAAENLSRLNAELEIRVAHRTAELEMANKELNSFSYTIAHDMRAPVRAMNGFGEMVLQKNRGKLDPESEGHLTRIVANSRHMSNLIDDLLNWARLGHQDVRRREYGFSQQAENVVSTLRSLVPSRVVETWIQPSMRIIADEDLMQVVLNNLIGNAWKFTSKSGSARIEFGIERRDGFDVFYVRDNGAGFDRQYAHKLFLPFQRLHHASEFEGTGIGLATVKKIIDRHGGKIWIDSAVGEGTTVYFTVGQPL